MKDDWRIFDNYDFTIFGEWQTFFNFIMITELKYFIKASITYIFGFLIIFEAFLSSLSAQSWLFDASKRGDLWWDETFIDPHHPIL